MTERYFVIRMTVAAFDTEAEARRFQLALLDAFMAIPEAADLMATAGVYPDDCHVISAEA
jgi:hypothetical protein